MRVPIETDAIAASGNMPSARTNPAMRRKRELLADASSSRTTALVSTKQPTAIASKSGVALRVASHSTSRPDTSTARIKMTSATASGMARIERTSSTTFCSVPMIFN